MIELPVYLIHWNAPEWCASAARSILASKNVKIHLSVVDNGSEDPTMLRHLLAPEARLIQAGRNAGYAGGANIALHDWLQSGDSELCVIGSHDLHTESETLALLVSAARSHSELGVVAPVLTAPEPSYGGHFDGRHWRQVTHVSDPPPLLPCDWASGTCLLLRRGCVEQIGGFDEEFGSYVEDVDLCLRAGDAGWPTAVVTAARAWGVGSASAAVQELIAVNSMRLRLKRGGRLGALDEMAYLLAQWVRAWCASIAPWRSSDRRHLSRHFASRNSARIRHALPVFLLGLRGSSVPATTVTPKGRRLSGST